MRTFNFLPTVAAVLSLTIAATSEFLSKYCPTENICFNLNIPANTASAGSGDIFFQITAPSSKQWVALGQGTRMSGANMFVVYASEDPSNVTISHRLGTGHVMPQYDSSTQIELLAGSGVADGAMVANVRCKNCQTWNGGSMDFSSNAATWIYAAKSGSELASNNVAEGIQQHDTSGTFSWDFSTARGGNDQNPFITSPVSSGTSSSSASKPTTTSSPSSGATKNGSSNIKTNNHDGLITTHGVLACGVFVGAFPIGGILIRIFSFPGLLWVHAGLQVLAMVVFIVAASIGIYVAEGVYPTHAVIGLILLAVLVFQPFFGWMHHRVFKSNHTRSFWSHGHLILGRILILGGLINGGLGLRLTGHSNGAYIAYSILAAIIGIVYTVATVIGEKRRARKLTAQKHGAAFVRGEELSDFDRQGKLGIAVGQRVVDEPQPPRWI